MLEELKQEVYEANLALNNHGLVTLTWGNVSGLNRDDNLIVIKPSGVSYDEMKPEDMVVVDFDGKVVEGKLKPSSDTPSHIELYKSFPKIGGITHSHSRFATVFCQAQKEIPCLGTTHADHFMGTIPVTRLLVKDEVESGYELNTGKIIVERFHNLDYESLPGVLVGGHAPFTWGKNAADSVKNNLILERVAEMALFTFQLNPGQSALPHYILNKHYERKHGKNAYYGQNLTNGDI